MAGQIHFVGGEKGGVGKSLTSRVLAQYYIDGQMPLIGFDSDSSHGTFSRFYGEFTAPVEITDYDSLDAILESAEAHPDHNIIVDLAAQTNTSLKQWLDDSDAFELLTELDYQAFVWHVMDDGADSMSLLGKLFERTKGKANAQLVVVKNYGRGDDFSFFEESDLLQAITAAGAKIMTLNKLQSSLLRKVDFNNLSFWAAANNRDIMGIAERRRVVTWLRDTFKEVESAIVTTFEAAEAETSPLKKAETVLADSLTKTETANPTVSIDEIDPLLDELGDLSDTELTLIEQMAVDAVSSMPTNTGNE